MAKILIVDDSPAQVFNLKQIVEDWGHETLTAENGTEALEIARKELPNVILLDVVMPGMNGFQATRKLTQDPKTASIPVIMITTKDQETDKIWGMRQGAVEYLVKPVADKELVAKIHSVMAA
mgnify:CR=1 FL=1